MSGGLRWFPVMLAVSLLTAILVAWSPYYWTNAVSVGAVSLVAIAWAAVGPSKRLPIEFVAVCLIGLWGFFQLSFGLTAVPSMTLRASLPWAGCAVAFLLGSTVLAERQDRYLFLQIMSWALGVIAIEAILQFFIAPRQVFGLFEGEESVVGTMFYRNQFAAVMEIGAGFALWQVRNGRTIVGGLLYACMFGAVVATASRAGAVLVGAELLIFLLFSLLKGSRLESSRLPVIVLIVCAVSAAAVVGTESLWDRFQEKDMFAVRTELRASTVRMVSDAPLTGRGIGTWRAAYPRYATMDASIIANEAHNDWLQWAADGGILFALLIFFVAIRAAVRSAPGIWGLGLPAVMLHCLVDYQLRTPAVSFLWFAMAGCACMRSPEKEFSGKL